jgi:hypothetical protein
MPKQYLGDGAYVDFDGFALILTAENGISATDTIVLEPSVYAALLDYVAVLKGHDQASANVHGIGPDTDGDPN